MLSDVLLLEDGLHVHCPKSYCLLFFFVDVHNSHGNQNYSIHIANNLGIELLENPLELHQLSLQVQDIIDNAPIFQKIIIKLEISKSEDKGARY